MPTLEVPQQRLKPTVPSGIQLAPSAFGAEARALQRLGQTIEGVAGTILDIDKKIKLLNESNQIDEGVLAYEQFLDKSATNRLKDTDFENHGPQFYKDHDQFVTEYLPKVKSKKAQEKLTRIWARQRAVQHTRITVDAFRKAGATERARQPLVVQQSVEDELAETDADEQEKIRSNFKQRLTELQAAGHLTEWQVQDQLKTRAMMLMQTVASRWPEAAIEALKSREMLSSVLTKEDIELLTDGDIDFLRKNAQKELSYAQDKFDAKKKAAIAEIKAQAASLAGKEDFAGAQKLLNANIELLGLQEHKLQSKNLEETSKYFGETGINYYKVTHMPSVYADLRRQIINETLKDDAFVWQKTGVNGISEEDAARLSRMIPSGGTESDFKNNAAAKLFNELFEQSLTGLTDIGRTGIINIFARETGYRWLEDSLKKNKDWTLRQQQEEAMRIFYRVQADMKAGRITTKPEDLPGSPQALEKIRKGMEELDKIDLAEIRKRRLERQGVQIKTITTQEQYDALPSGTRYRDANGAIGTKR